VCMCRATNSIHIQIQIHTRRPVPVDNALAGPLSAQYSPTYCPAHTPVCSIVSVRACISFISHQSTCACVYVCVCVCVCTCVCCMYVCVYVTYKQNERNSKNKFRMIRK